MKKLLLGITLFFSACGSSLQISAKEDIKSPAWYFQLTKRVDDVSKKVTSAISNPTLRKGVSLAQLQAAQKKIKGINFSKTTYESYLPNTSYNSWDVCDDEINVILSRNESKNKDLITRITSGWEEWLKTRQLVDDEFRVIDQEITSVELNAKPNELLIGNFASRVKDLGQVDETMEFLWRSLFAHVDKLRQFWTKNQSSAFHICEHLAQDDTQKV